MKKTLEPDWEAPFIIEKSAQMGIATVESEKTILPTNACCLENSLSKYASIKGSKPTQIVSLRLNQISNQQLSW